jgi:iron complex transport system substrate-binding protein
MVRQSQITCAARPRAWLLVAVLAALLAACTTPAGPAAAPTAAAITLTDAGGQTVTLAGPAQRIVSIAPSNTELIFAAGAGAQLVGRDSLSDFPAEAAAVASIGDVYPKVNTEALVALKPDLVLAADINSPEQIQALRDLGLTVFQVPNPVGLEGLYANLATIGRLTGHEQDAATQAAALQARVQAALAQVPQSGTRPKVYYELDATDPTKPYTAGPGTFIDTLITLAGGENVAAGLGQAYAQISSEELVRQNPDIILLGDAAYGVTPESVAARPGWDAIAAVQNGAIHPFDDNLASRPGPRLVDGLEALVKLLHGQ